MSEQIDKENNKECVETESFLQEQYCADAQQSSSGIETTDIQDKPSVDADTNSVDNDKQQMQTKKDWNSFDIKIEQNKTFTKSNNVNNKSNNSNSNLYNKLSDCFIQQQTQVIKHRNTLLKWFARITGSQLLVINILIFICILGDTQIIDTTLDFMKFFVGATFLELLGGLLIIVKFVFSHETYDMLKHLTYVEPTSDKS